MGKQLELETGIRVEEFLFCDRFNGSFLDCPIALHNAESDWVISVFNPSLNPREMFRVKLPHGHWRVFGWDFSASKWVPIKAEAICEDYMLESKETIINCELYIKIRMDPLDFNYVRLVFDEAVDLKLRRQPVTEKMEIANHLLRLELKSFYEDALFALHKGDRFEYFSFDMRYYQGIANPRKRQRDEVASSGMYMFVTNSSDNGGNSKRYANVYDVHVFKGEIIE